MEHIADVVMKVVVMTTAAAAAYGVPERDREFWNGSQVTAARDVAEDVEPRWFLSSPQAVDDGWVVMVPAPADPTTDRLTAHQHAVIARARAAGTFDDGRD